MLIATLFVIALKWNLPKCPSADEWMMKLLYTFTMQYYLTIKKN